MRRRARLWTEFALLFVVMPWPAMHIPPRIVLPVLWVITLVILVVLLRDRTFNRKEFWNAAAVRRHGRVVILRFLVVAPLVVLATWWLTPDYLFWLPQNKPWVWAVVMIGYPLASVYPQGVVYRAFFLHRYRAIFPRAAVRVAVGAAAFGYLHIIFGNWQAPLLTLAGGVLFTWTHERSRSLLLSGLEHAMYGLLLISSGWGIFVVKGGEQFIRRMAEAGG